MQLQLLVCHKKFQLTGGHISPQLTVIVLQKGVIFICYNIYDNCEHSYASLVAKQELINA